MIYKKPNKKMGYNTLLSLNDSYENNERMKRYEKYLK